MGTRISIQFRWLTLLLTVSLLTSPAWAQQQLPAVSAASQVEELTLEQAIALALNDNHLVKIAELEVGKVADDLAAIRTFRLPSLNLFSFTSNQLVDHKVNINNVTSDLIPGLDSFAPISVPRRLTTVISPLVVQPLTQQYRIGLNIEQGKLARDVASEKLRMVKQATVDKVKRRYYAILQTQSALDSVMEAIRLYRELDRVTGDYVVQQVALKTDSLEVKTRLASAEYDGLNLANQLATEKEQLNNLLGRDVRVDFRVSAVPDAMDFGLDLVSARNRALDQRPEVKEARLKVKQAEVDRRIKKSEYIPDVSLGFRFVTLRNFSNSVPQNYASVGVVVKWEVFDWGRKKNQLAGKDKVIEQTKSGLHEAESLVLIEVGDKFRKLQQTRQALAVAKLGQETARETLRVNTNKYKLTAALLSDVLQSQASLAEANHRYQQVLLGYWSAKAEFEKAIGEEK